MRPSRNTRQPAVQTVRDIMRDLAAAEELFDARAAARDRKQSTPPIERPSDPAIGILMRCGKPVYYAMIDGRKVERDTLAQLLAVLAKGVK